MAKFKIHRTFFLRVRDILFIIGDITDGTIKSGMKFRVGDKEFVIDHVDFVDGKINDIPYTHIALGITPNDQSHFDSILSENDYIEIEVH